jgi:YbbR domain-containing protein
MIGGMFKNLGIKFLSFILALALWFYVTNQGKTEMSFSIPLRFTNIPKDLELLRSSAEYITLRARGSADKIRNLSPQKIQASIDLSNSKRGEIIFYLTPDNFNLPKGLSVAELNPSDIKIKLEDTLSREVPIIPELKGESPYGYKVKKVSFTPPRAKIIGPVSVIKNIYKIYTNPIDISVLNKNSIRPVSLQLPQQPLRIIDNTPFYAHISIEEILGTKDLPGIPIIIDNSMDDVTLEPPEIKVVLKGPLAILQNLKKEDVVVNLDLVEKKPGIYHLPASVQLPDKLLLVKTHPELITVKVGLKKKKKESKKETS